MRARARARTRGAIAIELNMRLYAKIIHKPEMAGFLWCFCSFVSHFFSNRFLLLLPSLDIHTLFFFSSTISSFSIATLHFLYPSYRYRVSLIVFYKLGAMQFSKWKIGEKKVKQMNKKFTWVPNTSQKKNTTHKMLSVELRVILCIFHFNWNEIGNTHSANRSDVDHFKISNISLCRLLSSIALYVNSIIQHIGAAIGALRIFSVH